MNQASFDVLNHPHPNPLPEGEGIRGKHLVLALLLLLTLLPIHFARAGEAGPTQDEVFKSIQSNVDESVDGRKVFAVLVAGAAVAMLGVLYNRRQTRAAAPSKLNHQGKLLKELVKRGGLTRAQAKQLKLRAEQYAQREDALDSPITLLLCPSLLQKKG